MNGNTVMTGHCQELSACGNVETFGGKAVNLARVEQAGFRVPSTLAIGSGGLRLFLADNGFTPLVSSYLQGISGAGLSAGDEQYRRLVEKIREGEFPNELENEVRRRIRKFCRRNERRCGPRQGRVLLVLGLVTEGRSIHGSHGAGADRSWNGRHVAGSRAGNEFRRHLHGRSRDGQSLAIRDAGHARTLHRSYERGRRRGYL